MRLVMWLSRILFQNYSVRCIDGNDYNSSALRYLRNMHASVLPGPENMSISHLRISLELSGLMNTPLNEVLVCDQYGHSTHLSINLENMMCTQYVQGRVLRRCARLHLEIILAQI